MIVASAQCYILILQLCCATELCPQNTPSILAENARFNKC